MTHTPVQVQQLPLLPSAGRGPVQAQRLVPQVPNELLTTVITTLAQIARQESEGQRGRWLIYSRCHANELANSERVASERERASEDEGPDAQGDKGPEEGTKGREETGRGARGIEPETGRAECGSKTRCYVNTSGTASELAADDPRTSKDPTGRRARGLAKEGPAERGASVPEKGRGVGPQERGRARGPGPETGLRAPTTEATGQSDRPASAIDSPAETPDGPPTLRNWTDQQAPTGPTPNLGATKA